MAPLLALPAARITGMLLIAIGLLGTGYYFGASRESDRRDAQELAALKEADEAREEATKAADTHASASLAWKRKADSYYRRWQEALNHVNDDALSECPPAAAGAPAGCLLGAGWVSLYNAAWHPDGMPEDTAGADAVPGGADPATPREALVNIRTNAELCAGDRKRQRELIDLLKDLEVIHAGQTD